MFKKLLSYILWQGSAKPTKWYGYLGTIFNWCLVLFMELILIVGVPQLKVIPIFIRIVWVIFGSINLLFTGITLEYNYYSFLAVTFIGLPKAINKAKKTID